MIIEGKRVLLNNRKKYKVIICNNNDNIVKFIDYIKIFNQKNNLNKFISLDFEFNRSLDNTKREIALFQICFEASDDNPYIYMFYPPDLNNDQIDILKELLLNTSIKKIIHGGESLDIPYLFTDLLKTNKEYQNFCINLFDTKYLCEYYNLDNNLSENKCKIYYLLKQMKIIDNKQFDYLIDNEKKMGSISEIRIDVTNMSEELIKYSAYDVLYLVNLYNSFPKNTMYQCLIPEITSVHFIFKQTDFFKNFSEKIAEYNNYFTYYNSNNKKLITYFNEIYSKIEAQYINLFKILYFKKFYVLIIKYITYNIIISKVQVYKKKDIPVNGELYTVHDIIKNFINFKFLVTFIEKILFLIKQNLIIV